MTDSQYEKLALSICWASLGMSKLYDKHLFFVSKGLNWDDMPEDRRYKRVHDYVLGVNIPVNKRQDLARMLHHLKTAERVDPTSSELLELAIGVTIN